MKLNRYEGLAVAISLLVVGRALVALVRMLIGGGQ
jgi:hypothetical protein